MLLWSNVNSESYLSSRTCLVVGVVVVLGEMSSQLPISFCRSDRYVLKIYTPLCHVSLSLYYFRRKNQTRERASNKEYQMSCQPCTRDISHVAAYATTPLEKLSDMNDEMKAEAKDTVAGSRKVGSKAGREQEEALTATKSTINVGNGSDDDEQRATKRQRRKQ